MIEPTISSRTIELAAQSGLAMMWCAYLKCYMPERDCDIRWKVSDKNEGWAVDYGIPIACWECDRHKKKVEYKKKCANCGRVFHGRKGIYNNFRKIMRGGGKLGVYSSCRKCEQEFSKQYYWENKQQETSDE